MSNRLKSRGYKIAEGNYVVGEDEDFERTKLKLDKVAELTQFIDKDKPTSEGLLSCTSRECDKEDIGLMESLKVSSENIKVGFHYMGTVLRSNY